MDKKDFEENNPSLIVDKKNPKNKKKKQKNKKKKQKKQKKQKTLDFI